MNALRLNRLHVVVVVAKPEHVAASLRLLALSDLLLRTLPDTHHRTEIVSHILVEATHSTHASQHQWEIEIIYSTQHSKRYSILST